MGFFAKNNQVKAAIYAVSSLTMVYSAYIYYSKDNHKDKINIPTPKSSYPYIGHLLSLGDVPSNQIIKWHDEYGPIIRVKMGVQNWIFVADPILAHNIFSGFGMNTSARPYSTFTTKHYSFGGEGIVFSDTNKKWKEARTLVLFVLAPKNVEKYTPFIEQETDKLVERLIQNTLEHESIDVYSLIEMTTVNIMCNICIGTKFGSSCDPDFIQMSENIKEGAKLAAIDMDLPLFVPALKPLTYFLDIEKKMSDYVTVSREPFMQRLIKEASTKDGTNLIKEIEEKGYTFTDRQKSVIICDLIAAGTETVCATMYWLFAIICNMPEVQQKLQIEIDAFIRVKKRLPSFSERLEFPYMIAVIKETMRFKSATPFGIPHKATKDITVDGYTIPAGSVLISSNEYMHTKSSFFKNGEIFDPERYLGDDRLMSAAANGTVNERDHFNFGWGRRICPGSYLAEVEIFQAVVRIFSKCSIKTIINSKEKQEIPNLCDHTYRGITTLPKPYKMQIIERSDNLIKMKD